MPVVPRAFRLSALLNLRQAQEDRAAADLAAAAADRARAQQRRADTEAMLGQVTFPEGTHEALSFAAVTASRAAMSALMTEHTANIDAARAIEAARQRDYQDAHAKTLTLSKLAERHDEAFRTEENRAEQIVLDEIATTRFRKDQQS